MGSTPPKFTKAATLAFEGDTLVGSVGLVPPAHTGCCAPWPSLNPTGVRELADNYMLQRWSRPAARIGEIWLITTSADRYFERLGFARVARAEVPEAIAGTAQFSALCPSTAVVMRLVI